jgi:hypothetical protein
MIEEVAADHVPGILAGYSGEVVIPAQVPQAMLAPLDVVKAQHCLPQTPDVRGRLVGSRASSL